MQRAAFGAKQPFAGLLGPPFANLVLVGCKSADVDRRQETKGSLQEAGFEAAAEVHLKPYAHAERVLRRVAFAASPDRAASKKSISLVDLWAGGSKKRQTP